MFLPKVLEQTVEAEAPRDYFKWSALAAIAAVLKRNVYLDRYLFKVYPNIYVILIGKSGLRKGIAPAVMSRLVNNVNNTRVIEGRSSVQALIQELSKAFLPEGKQKPLTDACGFMVSPEMSASLIEDPQAMTIMTDLYDSQYHNKWKNRLKGSGLEILEQPTITWLAASNPEHLKDIITAREINGGFVGRTFLIHADKKNTINSLVRAPKVRLNYDELTQELVKISELKGEFKLDEEAIELFDEWYKTANSEESDDNTGTYERLDSHILKIAMLIQVGTTCSLTITKETIQEAIEYCAFMVRSATRTAEGKGQNPLGAVAKEIIGDLLNKDEISRAAILRKYWKDITAEDLNKIEDTLEQAGALDHIIRDGTKYYRLTDSIKEAMRGRK